jgi:hypothetical protein
MKKCAKQALKWVLPHEKTATSKFFIFSAPHRGLVKMIFEFVEVFLSINIHCKPFFASKTILTKSNTMANS